MQTKPAQSRFAHFLVRSICGITLATALITVGLAAYCWVDVQSFFAGAKPLEATVANLHSPAGEEDFRANRFRFDASLKQPVDGRQSVTMSGLYRVAAEDEGRAITVFHNPNHPIRWAISSPLNYIGPGVYGAISLLLLAAWGVLQLVLRDRKAMPMTSIAAACVALVSLAGTAITAAETPLLPQETLSAPTPTAANIEQTPVTADADHFRRVKDRDLREPISSGPQSDAPKDIPTGGLDVPVRVSSRFNARIVCFNGMVDSRSSCSTSNFQPNGTLHRTGKMTCGKQGHVSEIEWSFLERRGDNDVYRFTRRFPSDTAAVSTTTQDVEFSDGRVVVFEDEFQVIVIEPPKP